jgi:exportin-2 (importin alpha re-exporter)
MLLAIISGDNLEISVRLSASILLKNFVKTNWPLLEEDPEKVSPALRTLLKSTLIKLSIAKNISKPIRNQLSEAIHLVAVVEFPDNWPEFLAEIIDLLKTNDLEIIDALLDTLSRVFER